MSGEFPLTSAGGRRARTPEDDDSTRAILISLWPETRPDFLGHPAETTLVKVRQLVDDGPLQVSRSSPLIRSDAMQEPARGTAPISGNGALDSRPAPSA